MDWLFMLPVPYFLFAFALTLVLWMGFIGILSQYNPLNSENGADVTLQLVFFCFALAAAASALPFENLKPKLPIVVGAAVLAGTGLPVGFGIAEMFWMVSEGMAAIGGVIFSTSIFALSLAISILALESLIAAFQGAIKKG